MRMHNQKPCHWTRFFVAAGVATVAVMTAAWANAEEAFDPETGEVIEIECRVIQGPCKLAELWSHGRPDEQVLVCEQFEVCKVVAR